MGAKEYIDANENETEWTKNVKSITNEIELSEENKIQQKKQMMSLINEKEVQFKQKLSRIRFLIEEVSADGNCLFRAISD